MFALLGLILIVVGCSSNTTKSGSDWDRPFNPGAARPPLTTGAFEIPSRAGPEHPVRLAVAGDGTVFVSDTRVNQVIGFREGKKVIELGGLDRPLGIAVSGKRLFVGNVGRQDVEVYDLQSRGYSGVLGGGQGEVSMPNSIAVALDGRIFVADSRENVVKAYAADGARMANLGGPGSGDGQFLFPVAVAVDERHVVVADQGNHRVQVFDTTGRWERSFGSLPDSKTGGLADLRGRFTTMSGVALHDGDIYVVDSAHGHVQVLDGAGNPKRFLGRVGTCGDCTRLALDIAFAPDGSLLVSDPLARRWVTPTEVTP